MIHKSLAGLTPFEAGDKTRFIEVLHPKNDAVDTGFSLGHASLEVGECSLPHILEACSETYYFLRGEGEICVNEEVRKVKADDLVFVPAGATQYLQNTGKTTLECLVVVEPAWYAAQERILQNS